MAIQKCTMLFETRTDKGRVSGFSETWYRDGTIADNMLQLQDLSKRGAGLLSNADGIIGQRIQQLGGRAVTASTSWPGVQVVDQDIPQVAALCYVLDAGKVYKKTFLLRAMVDDSIIKGDLVTGRQLTALFQSYANELGASWRFRVRDVTKPVAGLISIAADGTFVLTGDLVFNQGDYLTMLRVKSTLGKAVKGNFYVGTKVDSRNGKFANWGGQIVAANGKVRVFAYDYALVDRNSFTIVRSAVRKVGRPFFLYRGRAAVRK